MEVKLDGRLTQLLGLQGLEVFGLLGVVVSVLKQFSPRLLR